MDVILNNLLILTIFFPLAASLLIFVLPDDAKDTARRLALLFSLVPLVLVLIMWFNYDGAGAGGDDGEHTADAAGDSGLL